MTITTFAVDGMTCDHCERAVHRALVEVVGVGSDVHVSAADGVVSIDHETSIDEAAVRAAVAEAGYDVRL